MEQLIKDIEQYLSVTQQDDWYIRSKNKQQVTKLLLN